MWLRYVVVVMLVALYIAPYNKYSKFRHLCNSQTTLKTTLVLLHKLVQYNCLWLIKLTTCVVLVLAVFLLQRCLNLL